MTLISTQNTALPAPLRFSDRRVAALAIVKDAPELIAERRNVGRRRVRQSRGRRAEDQISRHHAPAPVQAFATSGEVFVGLQNLGEMESQSLRPSAYEAASRYEDHQFEPIKPGRLGRISA